MYKFKGNLNTTLALLVPAEKIINGIVKKTYPKVEEITKDMLFMASFRTFGGTESEVNGILTLQNTAVIECWYRPDIKANCRICVMNTKQVYEILGEPENIEMRNQFLKFKVKKVGGKV